MSAVIWARRAAAWSGGESRADGPADDPEGPGELDPVRVDAGCRGGGAGQGADRVVGKQVALDLRAEGRYSFWAKTSPRIARPTSSTPRAVAASLNPSARYAARTPSTAW